MSAQEGSDARAGSFASTFSMFNPVRAGAPWGERTGSQASAHPSGAQGLSFDGKRAREGEPSFHPAPSLESAPRGAGPTAHTGAGLSSGSAGHPAAMQQPVRKARRIARPQAAADSPPRTPLSSSGPSSPPSTATSGFRLGAAAPAGTGAGAGAGAKRQGQAGSGAGVMSQGVSSMVPAQWMTESLTSASHVPSAPAAAPCARGALSCLKAAAAAGIHMDSTSHAHIDGAPQLGSANFHKMLQAEQAFLHGGVSAAAHAAATGMGRGAYHGVPAAHHGMQTLGPVMVPTPFLIPAQMLAPSGHMLPAAPAYVAYPALMPACSNPTLASPVSSMMRNVGGAPYVIPASLFQGPGMLGWPGSQYAGLQDSTRGPQGALVHRPFQHVNALQGAAGAASSAFQSPCGAIFEAAARRALAGQPAHSTAGSVQAGMTAGMMRCDNAPSQQANEEARDIPGVWQAARDHGSLPALASSAARDQPGNSRAQAQDTATSPWIQSPTCAMPADMAARYSRPGANLTSPPDWHAYMPGQAVQQGPLPHSLAPSRSEALVPAPAEPLPNSHHYWAAGSQAPAPYPGNAGPPPAQHSPSPNAYALTGAAPRDFELGPAESDSALHGFRLTGPGAAPSTGRSSLSSSNGSASVSPGSGYWTPASSDGGSPLSHSPGRRSHDMRAGRAPKQQGRESGGGAGDVLGDLGLRKEVGPVPEATGPSTTNPLEAALAKLHAEAAGGHAAAIRRTVAAVETSAVADSPALYAFTTPEITGGLAPKPDGSKAPLSEAPFAPQMPRGGSAGTGTWQGAAQGPAPVGQHQGQEHKGSFWEFATVAATAAVLMAGASAVQQSTKKALDVRRGRASHRESVVVRGPLPVLGQGVACHDAPGVVHGSDFTTAPRPYLAKMSNGGFELTYPELKQACASAPTAARPGHSKRDSGGAPAVDGLADLLGKKLVFSSSEGAESYEALKSMNGPAKRSLWSAITGAGKFTRAHHILRPSQCYEVQAGDTLASIASKHHESVPELLRKNPHLGGRDTVFPKDRLLL